mmetsp:Transcript_68357/g.142494  ORF Transcript_68357/g.142494 Transcript_68357/m.142494 type:complete len:88 (+) Transcript_68357:1624-1887(+)
MSRRMRPGFLELFRRRRLSCSILTDLNVTSHALPVTIHIYVPFVPFLTVLNRRLQLIDKILKGDITISKLLHCDVTLRTKLVIPEEV